MFLCQIKRTLPFTTLALTSPTIQVQPATQSVSGNEVRLFGPASFVSASADRADVHADRADVLVCGQCRWKTLQRGDQLPGNAICGVFDYANHQCLAFVGRNYWRQPSCDGNQGELGAAYTSDDPFAGVSAEPFQKPLDMCAGGERHLEVGGPGEDEATRAGANGFFKVRSPHRHFWKYNSGAAGWMLGWKSGGGHEYQVGDCCGGRWAGTEGGARISGRGLLGWKKAVGVHHVYEGGVEDRM